MRKRILAGMSENWKEKILRKARLSGMCKENLSALRQCTSKEQAIELYMKTIDWALENDYPSLDEIRKHFNDCEDYGVFVDHSDLNVTASKLQSYVFHNCKGIVNVEMDYKHSIIPMLYFANDCNIIVTCKQKPLSRPIRVPIYVCGDNHITADITPNASFITYKIGD